LDKALLITIGREIWGVPKFQATFSLEVEDGLVGATVVQEGNYTKLGASLQLGEPILRARNLLVMPLVGINPFSGERFKARCEATNLGINSGP
jgi:hypothetical protein